MSDLQDILRKARALVDCVAFDDCGQVIGTQLVGGNGGLLSRETIKAADTLRLALSDYREDANLHVSQGDTEMVTP